LTDKIKQVIINTTVWKELKKILLQYKVYRHTYTHSQNTTIKQWYINVLHITMLNATTCFGLNRPSSGCRTKGETYNRGLFGGTRSRLTISYDLIITATISYLLPKLNLDILIYTEAYYAIAC
jgi:hypothetical protein